MKAVVRTMSRPPVRMSLLLAAAVVGFLMTTGTALAEEMTHSRGGPGKAGSGGANGSVLEIVAVLVILAGVAAVIYFEARHAGKVEERTVVPSPTEHRAVA